MELVVVIGILVVLSGIVVVLLPGLMFDAHAANGTTNIDELNKAVFTYDTLNRKMPNGFDSMVTTAGNVTSYLLFTSNNTASAHFSAHTLTGDEVKSLKKAGITQVYDYDDTLTDFNPTFNCTSSTARSLAANGAVLSVDASEVQSKLGLGTDSTATYVCFGVGKYCTMVGAKRGGITEAPVRGTPSADSGPDKSYGRYALIYRLGSDGDAASFVGAACPGGDGLGTSEFLMSKYYANQE